MLLQAIRKHSILQEHGFTAVKGPVAGVFFEMDTDVLAESGARLAEGSTLRAMPVGAAGASEFTAFLDGVQRAEVKLHHGIVPIVYAFGSAVIREREQRQMRTQRKDAQPWLIEREALFFPSSYIPQAVVEKLVTTEDQLVDTTPAGSAQLPLFPPQLYARAALHVNRWRESLERELAERWCANDQNGWLLLDGSLTLAPAAATHVRTVGVIKSHRTRFFDGDDARVVLSLNVGERTSVFEPTPWRHTPVRSWYLRLRPATGRDVFWGLVRVEMSAAQEPAMADEISRWLLAETTPLSLPDARWDRLLYAIHDCEEFLRARAPTL